MYRAAGEQADERFHEMFDALPLAIYVTDAEGRLTYCNTAAVKLTGCTSELGVERWRADECPIGAPVRGGDPNGGMECVAERPDGTRFWFIPYSTVLRDSEGRVAARLHILVDITAQRIARSETERAALLLSAIVDSSDDAIVSKDLNGVITSWNKSAERLFGYTEEETVGKPITIIIPPDRQDEEPQILERLRSGQPVDHFETIRRAKDGRLVDISLTISPVRDSSGVIIGASKIARDITERKRVEAEMLRVSQALEQFAFSASHDLQEPLRTVKVYSELLMRRYGDQLEGEALQLLGYVHSGATRMEMLVHDLLAYAEVTTHDRLPETTDANDVLSSALNSLSGLISDTGARISSDPLPCVPMRRVHLEQLFQNLMGNAIKYRSPERPPALQITAEHQKGYWIFAISDNGIGIAPEYKEKIFGLFKRLHTRDAYSGTGLGLAICQRIVDLYHGRIWVESDPGQGSVFRFSIPE